MERHDSDLIFRCLRKSIECLELVNKNLNMKKEQENWLKSLLEEIKDFEKYSLNRK